MRLLIVEDEAPILRGLLRKVKALDLPFQEIAGAPSAEEALEDLRQHPADLVMTDINMPQMNGLEFIQAAQNEDLCGRFIILTGYDDFSYARSALRLKVIDYLLKPINDEQLGELLTKIGEQIQAELDLQNEQEDEAEVELHEDSFPAEMDKPDAGKQMLEYIEANYQTDLSLSSVAEQVGLHPNYVSYLFKKETGMNVLAYIHQLRVVKAKELIVKRPNLPLSEVAVLTGFENPRHFYKVFKKHTGMTPRQFGEYSQSGNS
ncbi:response regulator transcription factor [Paenibacillus albus]|uniref:Helix-turn-helix domain-containing protein n=1 Tax=Paenibacillus albus TaxID=2495582 RepID=A0A3Q8X5A2_9BACL|nr:helix-turn-helix domain-containing protein [Paenibacillus albus]AZN39235.1 helix-turn-helix domain-containing protein [Paenibacillus albus]